MFRVGDKWKMRNGKIATILDIWTGHGSEFDGMELKVEGKRKHEVIRPNGKAGLHEDESDPRDLIEKVD